MARFANNGQVGSGTILIAASSVYYTEKHPKETYKSQQRKAKARRNKKKYGTK